MISIEFTDNNKKATECKLKLEYIRNRFGAWCAEYNPCWVTRMILGNLTDKYAKGDKDALFGKMKQLEDYEQYELCAIVKNMMDHMNLNYEYLQWESEQL